MLKQSRRNLFVLATRLVFSFMGLAWSTTNVAAQDAYFPGKWGDWKTAEASEVGMDADKLAAAVEFAIASENTTTRDLSEAIADSFGREPFFKLLGPTKPRGGASGLVIRRGLIVAEWGDTHRVDMTFSVTKSYLSTVAGLAVDDGLIRNVDDRVADYVRDGKFDGAHNGRITWKHLLQQTSDWSGELWEQPDWGDRPQGDDPEAWENRTLQEPGSFFKYNDVRVNLLAYSLLQVMREPLPKVLRERIMDPIGASPTWRWHGYENSWVTLDGQYLQSVSGGGHWGGGMFICARDHARFGLLFLRKGNWNGQQLLSEAWIEALQQPAEARADYGFMWWLNTNQARIASAPASAYYAAGFGGNYIYVDNDNDLVVVLRWTPNVAEVLEQILGSIDD